MLAARLLALLAPAFFQAPGLPPTPPLRVAARPAVPGTAAETLRTVSAPVRPDSTARPRLGTRGTAGVSRTIRTDAVLRIEENAEVAPIDLVIPGIGAQPIEVLRRGDDVLMPLGVLGRFAGLAMQPTTPTRWAGQIEEKGPFLEVDAVARTLRYGANRRELDATTVAIHNNEVCLSVRTLVAVTGLEVQMDWASLSAQVLRADKLPAMARRARLAAQQAAQRAAQAPQVAQTLPVDRHLLKGFVLDYSVNGPVGGKRPSNGAYFVVGTELLGGGLEIRENLRTGAADATGRFRRLAIGDQDVTGLWSTGWERGVVRQVRIGEIGGTGVVPRLLQGVAISNAPYRRGSRFGMRAYEGQIGPQWEIEVYQNGVLVVVDSTDAMGRYRVEVPVQYGENPVEIIAYGPGGERRSLAAQTRIPSSLIPRGHAEYGVSGGKCATYHCRATANADLRVGLTNRLVLLGGADYFTRAADGAIAAPYAGFVVAGPAGLTAEGLAQPQGVSRVDLHFDPTPRARLEASARQYAFADTLSPFALPRGRQREIAVSGMLRTGGARDVTLEGSGSRVEDIGGTTDYLSASTAVRLAGVTVQPYLRANLHRADASRSAETFVGGRLNLTPPRLIRDKAGVSSLVFEGESRPGTGLSFVSASLMHSLGPRFRATARTEWRPSQGALLTVTATLDRATARLTSTITQSGRGLQDNHQVAGSVRWDDEFFLTAEDGVQRGTIVGTAFLDANVNGVREPGEPGIPYVGLSTEYRMAETDARGHYIMRGLDPYQMVTVSLDTTFTPDPSVAPRFLQLRATPIAHSVARVDIPFLPSGTIEGRVLLAAGGGLYAQANVPLDVVDRTSGRVYHATTFADGTFYLTGMVPSHYVVTVRGDVLAVRQWEVQPAEVFLPAVAGGAAVRELRVVVRPQALAAVSSLPPRVGGTAAQRAAP